MILFKQKLSIEVLLKLTKIAVISLHQSNQQFLNNKYTLVELIIVVLADEFLKLIDYR